MRRNKVRHVLSNIVAENRGSYFKFDKEKENLSLQLNIDSFIRGVKHRIRFEEEERYILQDLAHHEVVYEDDCEIQENNQDTVNKILDFLSLDRKPVSTRLKKVNITPLHKLIKNYEQFEKRIIQEGWGKFLN